MKALIDKDNKIVILLAENIIEKTDRFTVNNIMDYPGDLYDLIDDVPNFVETFIYKYANNEFVKYQSQIDIITQGAIDTYTIQLIETGVL